ncbi:TetR/AcrR family transcriptional regulator [Bacillus sp. T33-2]|uniref:TetR/AcrR family transcriptional regulator n=1 Tax=Bacillus sp. T33-2 TaxID=2054168 RepID=UPI000C776FED|nr:TetR/AcrR family transcriptional regulator [Bacillus sp. T33-2]PLR95413.1 TetR/AcrR family transcriptional regulator [Bacillus sp. T33-2]
MKEKEKTIIEAAIKLFAAKGYASTSIQEIVTESGISKGAFYLYFKSKDALLVAILEYYFDRLQRNVAELEGADLPPREKFTRQLTALFMNIVEHKEFIIMQSREQAIPLNDSVRHLILKRHYNIQKFYREGLSSIYGHRIDAYLWDLAFMLEGLFQSYLKVLLFDSQNFKIDELVHFIMRRMDSIIEGITGEKPIVTEEKMEFLLKKTRAFFLNDKPDIKAVIGDMKKHVASMKDHEDLEVSLEVLEAEALKDSPRLPVIKGMLSNFKGIDSLEHYIYEVARSFDVKI